MGVWEWGNFGSQKVRSAINGTIFQPFGFKFGLYSLLLGIYTCKTEKFPMETDLGPFSGTDPFKGTKITRSHNYGTECS